MKTRKIQTIEANMHAKNSHTTMEALLQHRVQCNVLYTAKAYCGLMYRAIYCSLMHSAVQCSLIYSVVQWSLMYTAVSGSLMYSALECSTSTVEFNVHSSLAQF